MNVYALLTPIAIFFVLLEIAACFVFKRKYINFQEAVANFGTALGNQTTNLLVAAGVYEVYGWLHANYRVAGPLEMTPVNFILLLLGVDFIFYWVHRWGHEMKIMWAAHSPHHSAEEMNFFVALRASVTQRLFSFFFFWPLTLVGFTPFDIYTMTALHLFISFLHHTEFIPKLWRPIEFIFTTPSHHRVHHGANYQYLDKNFGEFLIIWDRMFSTFAEEREKIVYGMYNHPQSFNPIKINFHYYVVIFREMLKAPGLFNKLRIWFMPLSWSPEGKKPLPPEITVQNQKRYQSVMFDGAKTYLVVHAILTAVLMLFVISPKSPLSYEMKWVGAILLWHSIINWAGILESKRWLLPSELLRLTLTAVFVFQVTRRMEIQAVVCSLAVFSTLWSMNYFRLQRPHTAAA
ncbi:MAG TPA: sterol desaturase family protein [Turneriella sp.]|nr:sterol desaturase family protein [Turneriella sp.]